MRSLKQTNRKLGYCKPMTPHSNEVGSERWRVRGSKPGSGYDRGNELHSSVLAWRMGMGGMIFVYDCAPSGHDVFDIGTA